MNFTADSKLGDIVNAEGGLDALHAHGVPCPTCPMAAMEMDKLTIGMVCEGYGLDLEAILADLNK